MTKSLQSKIVLFVFMFEVWDSFYVSVVRNFKDILLLDRPELLFPNNCILPKSAEEGGCSQTRPKKQANDQFVNN